MLGMLVLALRDFGQLLKLADLTAAMSVEALLGTDRVFRPELHAHPPAPGPGRLRREFADAAQGFRRSRLTPWPGL